MELVEHQSREWIQIQAKIFHQCIHAQWQRNINWLLKRPQENNTISKISFEYYVLSTLKRRRFGVIWKLKKTRILI